MHPTAIHDIIKSSLGPVSKNQAGFNSYHRMLDQHLSNITTGAPHPTVGHPTSRRMKGWWEKHGDKQSHASHHAPNQSHHASSTAALTAPLVSEKRSRAASDHAPSNAPPLGIRSVATDAGADGLPFGWNLNFKGKSEEPARAFLRRWGAHERWIVEVFPQKEHPGYIKGDRWFMKIVNGVVQGAEKKQFITACRWMIKNSVTRMDTQGYPNAEPCEILQIKAYGPPECPLFADLVRPGTQPATATRLIADASAEAAAALNVHWVKGPIGWLLPGSATLEVPGSAVYAKEKKAASVVRRVTARCGL